MGEDIRCDAYLEVYDDGSCLAQLVDLPGCYARGGSEEEALAALAVRIPAYYAWLRRHDDYTPEVHGPFRTTVAERVLATNPGHGTHGAFFSSDCEPVTDEDLDWALALLEWAYSDLEEILDARSRAGGHIANRAQAVANTVAAQQVWLLTRLGADTGPMRMDQPCSGALDRLRQARRASLTRLRASSGPEREQTLRLAGEQWSLRKVLRRSILQVRMQTDELAATQEG